jgi:hypothetical protein
MKSLATGYGIHIFLLAVVLSIFLGDYLHDEYGVTHVLASLWYIPPAWVFVLLCTGIIDYTIKMLTIAEKYKVATEARVTAFMSTATAFVIVSVVAHVINLFFFTVLNQVGRG